MKILLFILLAVLGLPVLATIIIPIGSLYVCYMIINIPFAYLLDLKEMKKKQVRAKRKPLKTNQDNGLKKVI